MHLELICHRPEGTVERPPLLFVHGAYAGAWVWEPHFLPYFAAQGYTSYALSLRGHGESEGGEQRLLTRLKHYVADVEAAVARIGTPPVLIGHSMGGVVVQKYMHRNPVPGVVLMSSGPPYGLFGCWLNMVLTQPLLLAELTAVQMLGPTAPVDIENIRRWLFSDDTPAEVLYRMVPRMVPESPLVVLDMWGLGLPPSRSPGNMPMLVVGAERDAFIHPGAVMATAWTYRTEPTIFPDVGHAMMLDHHWEMVAERIAHWLEATLPRLRAGGMAIAAA